MSSQPRETPEIFRDAIYFVSVGGFGSSQDFYNFCRAWNIQKNVVGWPVFQIMMALNRARKSRTVAGSKQEELTDVKIEKEKTLIAIKRRDYIERDLAVNRIRITLLATAQKIKYAIKMAAPRVCGLFHAPDVENVLTECYNTAIEQLENEAEQIESWETYGTQTNRSETNSLEQGGDQLVNVTEEDTGEGSSYQDTSFQQE